MESYQVCDSVRLTGSKEPVFLIFCRKGCGGMSKEELMKISVEEFSRLQKWMLSVKERDSETYNLMYERYIELKVILSNLGVNLAEFDRIKA